MYAILINLFNSFRNCPMSKSRCIFNFAINLATIMFKYETLYPGVSSMYFLHVVGKSEIICHNDSRHFGNQQKYLADV